MGIIAGLDQLPAHRPASVPAYIDDKDVLTVHVWNSTGNPVLAFWARVLDLDGIIQTFSQTFTPPTSVVETIYRMPLISGYLLSAGLHWVSGTASRGQTWATIVLERTLLSGDVRTLTISKGFLSTAESVSWPPAKFADSLDGQGAIASTSVGNPSAGADFSSTVPARQRYVVRGVRFLLTTAVAAATRLVHLLIYDGSQNVLDLPAQTTQTASLAYTYYFSPFGFTPAVVGTTVFVAIPSGLLVPQAWSIKSLTDNIQAADQISVIRLYLETWVDP